MEKDNILTAAGDPYEIDRMDRKILQLLVDHMSITNVEIGRIVGLHEQTVSKRKNKPAFLKAHEDLMSTCDDLLKRAQKMAARRLLNFIKDPDKKFALDAMKVALNSLPQKKEVSETKEIIFQTRVGTQGQLMQEVIKIPKSDRRSDTSPTPPTLDAESDDLQENRSDNQDKS